MTADVRLRPEAERDVSEAAAWYEGQREGLGDEFLDELLNTLTIIAQNPNLYPVIHRETHRALIHRFPFGVFYQVEGRQVAVLAVMHAKRHPRRWMGRL